MTTKLFSFNIDSTGKSVKKEEDNKPTIGLYIDTKPILEQTEQKYQTTPIMPPMPQYPQVEMQRDLFMSHSVEEIEGNVWKIISISLMNSLDDNRLTKTTHLKRKNNLFILDAASLCKIITLIYNYKNPQMTILLKDVVINYSDKNIMFHPCSKQIETILVKSYNIKYDFPEILSELQNKYRISTDRIFVFE